MNVVDGRHRRRAEAANSPARRQRLSTIVSEATRLFHGRGYEATSVNDLAASLDMSVGGLYRYIDTKSDLLVMVCEEIYGDLPARLAAIADQPAASTQRLVTLLDKYIRSCIASRPLILLMYREYRHLPDPARARFQEREEAIAALFQRVVDEGIAAGDFARGVDSWALAHDIVLIGHLPALKSWAFKAGGRKPADLVDQQIHLILESLAAGGRAPSAPGTVTSTPA